MQRNKLIVIGAGISGLTAAVYACRSGFEVLVLEKGLNPGGLSTCWERKGFMFEGGVHWLTGSSPERPLYRVWKESGALKENNPIYNKDPYFVLETSHGEVPLYRNPDKMYETLAALYPSDRFSLKRLRRHLKWFKYFHTPVGGLRGLKESSPSKFNPMEFIRMTPALLLTPFLWAESAGWYAKRFRSQELRTLFGGIMNPGHNALSFIVTLSSFAYGDSGYPTGGSLLMARNMSETLLSLGGEIRYRCEVSEVCRERGVVKGVRVEETFIPADAVIVSTDARIAIDSFFGRPLEFKWARRMREKLHTAQCMFIGIGVQGDYSHLPKSMVFALSSTFEAGGLSYESITLHNYARDGYAPEGCTTLTVLLLGDCYKYWKEAKDAGTYREKKADVVSRLLEVLYGFLPSLRGNVVVTDMATPLTVERYCGTYEGSYMAVWRPCTMPVTAPVRLHKGLYFCGQRTSLSGGLPIAASTGRKAAQHLCRDFRTVFVNE